MGQEINSETETCTECQYPLCDCGQCHYGYCIHGTRPADTCNHEIPEDLLEGEVVSDDDRSYGPHHRNRNIKTDGWTVIEGGFELLPLVPEAELIRVGMTGGRALIEEKKKKAVKDNLTMDMFDTQKSLF